MAPSDLPSRGTALHLLLSSTGVQIMTPPLLCKMLLPFPVQGCRVAPEQQILCCLETGIPRKADWVQQKPPVCSETCPRAPDTPDLPPPIPSALCIFSKDPLLYPRLPARGGEGGVGRKLKLGEEKRCAKGKFRGARGWGVG